MNLMNDSGRSQATCTTEKIGINAAVSNIMYEVIPEVVEDEGHNSSKSKQG